jgi:hypothetical protein
MLVFVKYSATKKDDILEAFGDFGEVYFPEFIDLAKKLGLIVADRKDAHVQFEVLDPPSIELNFRTLK